MTPTKVDSTVAHGPEQEHIAMFFDSHPVSRGGRFAITPLFLTAILLALSPAHGGARPVVAPAAPMAGRQTAAATELARRTLRSLPASGRRAEDFVPKLWRVSDRTTGDLNNDAIPDIALAITPDRDNPAIERLYEADGYLPPTHIVMVLFAGKNGQLRKAGANDRLGPGTFPESAPHVEIRRGVLIVNDNYGNSQAWDTTYRFRYDKASGKFLLIGYDHETYSRPGTNDRVRTSENYLTGQRIDLHQPYEERPDGTRGLGAEKITRTPIPRFRVALEEVGAASPESDSIRPFDEAKARPVVIAPAGKSVPGLSGNWSWFGPANKEKARTGFYLSVRQSGSRVSGNYGVNVVVDGEADHDSSVVPFVGTIRAGVATIEFDPEAEYTLDEANVRYRKPKGKAPSIATARLVNGKLEWTLLRGANVAPPSMGIPRKMTLLRP